VNLLLLRMVAGRLLVGMLSLLAVSIVVFTITALLPGDAAQEQLGQDATPEALAALREQMGLNKSGAVRYWEWLAGMVRGNPGESSVTKLPVAQLIGGRLPNSLLLAGITALVSVPEFLIATLAVLIFAVHLRWLPALSSSASVTSLKSFALPVLSLACVIIAQMMRMTRAAVIDQLSAAYIEMVKLKGATPARMVLAHALPNAVGPIANAVALSLSYLLGGVIIVEVIFNYPGIAKLMVDAVAQRDMPLVQACAMIFCAAYLILVTLADVCSIVANPRLRHQ
jgi:peptide/nickel transport system permease protein